MSAFLGNERLILWSRESQTSRRGYRSHCLKSLCLPLGEKLGHVLGRAVGTDLDLSARNHPPARHKGLECIFDWLCTRGTIPQRGVGHVRHRPGVMLGKEEDVLFSSPGWSI